MSDADEDRYERGAEIARGGMGRVIEAVDRRLGRTVAIKEALEPDGVARRRFEREVRITARLEHPSIVPVHDAGVGPGGEPFYVMRRVSGRPLDQRIAGAATLDARLTLLPHLVAVVDAVAHAHGRGVIHRDIKPANILVGEHGETVLIDWGLAKVLGEDGADVPSLAPPAAADDLRTRAGEVCGTPGFMAPEQALAGHIDARSDVFALGACLYHLLAGVPPFHGASGTEVLDRTVVESPTALRELVAGVPPDLVTIVEKAMAREANDRYPDAIGLRDDLRRFLAGQLVASHHYSARQRLGRALRRYRAVLAVGALALTVLIVIGVLSLRRIFADRDRLARERNRVELALAGERARADELIVTQAQFALAQDPTLAIATLKQVPPDSPAWERARPLVAQARLRGIAVGFTSGGGDVARGALSGDLLATSVTHQITVHDLVGRTSRTLVEDPGARIVWVGWAGPLVVWRDDAGGDHAVGIADPRTGAVRKLAWPGEITQITTATDGTIALVDRAGTVATADATTDLPPVPVDRGSPAASAYISRSGRWLVVAAPDQARVFRRAPDHGWREVGRLAGEVLSPVFDAGETRMATMLDLHAPGSPDWADVVELALTDDRAAERARWKAPKLIELAYTGLGLNGISLDMRLMSLVDGEIAPLANTIAGTQIARLAPVRDGFLVFDATNRIVLQRGGQRSYIRPPLVAELIVSSPTGRYVAALARSEVMVWDLEQQLPAIARADPNGIVLFTDDDTVVTTTATRDARMALIRYSVATGETREALRVEFGFGLWPIGDGRFLNWTGDEARRDAWIDASLDRAHPLTVPHLVDVKSLDRTRVAVTTTDHAIVVVDASSGQVMDQIPIPDLDRIAANTGWLAATTGAPAAWRRGPDGRTETVALAGLPTAVYVAATGDVYLGIGQTIVGWRAGAAVVRPIATVPLGVESITGVAGGQLGVVTSDLALHLVDPETGTARAVLPGCRDLPAIAAGGSVAVTACLPGLEVADLTTGQAWTVPDLSTSGLQRVAVSPDGNTVAALFARGGGAGEVSIWRIGLPRGRALAAWVAATTNATTNAAGRIEWR